LIGAEERLLEQTEYLEGVLWSDPMHRLDKDAGRDVSREIDPYGTCTKAFWRAVLETAGYIALTVSGERKYPRITLGGCYSFLLKFVDFLHEEMDPMVWADTDAKLRFMVSGGQLRITGVRAQDVCRVLYMGQEIGLDSIRHKVDEILMWTGA
jgi:hypothetical protein